MGLITCSKCKKIYDYDKYNGICPKCARYNKETTAAEDHQEYHNKYDGGYSHTAQEDHHVYHQKYDENKNPHASGAKMDKKTKIILGVIIGSVLLSAFTFFGPFFLIVAVWAVCVVVKGKKKK